MIHRFHLTATRIALCVCGMHGIMGIPARSEEYNLERYQVIINRAPFGSVASADAQGAAAANAAAELAARQYRLTMLVDEGSGGACAGIVDAQTQKSYVLFKGEPTPEGMELKEVRMESEEAVIRIGMDIITLKISSGAGAMPNAPGSSRMSGVSRSRPYSGRSYGPPGSSRMITLPSRVAPPPTPVAPVAPPAPPSQPALKGEELEKQLREYNLQNIRSGGPPLPIQLTPEEDAKLVEEGVLPAQ